VDMDSPGNPGGGGREGGGGIKMDTDEASLSSHTSSASSEPRRHKKFIAWSRPPKVSPRTSGNNRDGGAGPKSQGASSFPSEITDGDGDGDGDGGDEDGDQKHGAAGPKIDFAAADAPKNLQQLAQAVVERDFVYPVESAFITSQNQAKLKPKDRIKSMRNLPEDSPYAMLPGPARGAVGRGDSGDGSGGVGGGQGHSDRNSSHDGGGGGGDKVRPISTCAVVGNSGVLIGSAHGAAIDRHVAVFRINQAPTIRYERQVGSKVTFRLLNKKWANIYAHEVGLVRVLTRSRCLPQLTIWPGFEFSPMYRATVMSNCKPSMHTHSNAMTKLV